MIGKVKRWLGIEGVKLELQIPEKIQAKDGKLEGSIVFYSLNEQIVRQLRIVLVERYARGRGKEKLVDEYLLGEEVLDLTLSIPANTPVELPFSLTFSMVESEMDELEKQNFLFGGAVRAAKWLHRVKSVYRVEAEARVEGTALDPFDKKEIVIK
jgi:hypothetical protein